ncbi:MAG: alpha/beta hydrolase [Chloroflexi bacterium]|nr:alpha/beta hydrolase [Chloroflexota bacterium]
MSDEDLQRIDLPTLVKIGENEVIYSAQKAMQRLDTVAPAFEKAIIPDASHGVMISQKDLANRKILDFLG